MTEEEIKKAANKYMNECIEATYDDGKEHDYSKECSFYELKVAFAAGVVWAKKKIEEEKK